MKWTWIGWLNMEIPQWVKCLSDDSLIKEWRAYHESIYIIKCFGSKDVLIEWTLAQELERRGYKITGKLNVVKVKTLDLDRVS